MPWLADADTERRRVSGQWLMAGSASAWPGLTKHRCLARCGLRRRRVARSARRRLRVAGRTNRRRRDPRSVAVNRRACALRVRVRRPVFVAVAARFGWICMLQLPQLMEDRRFRADSRYLRTRRQFEGRAQNRIKLWFCFVDVFADCFMVLPYGRFPWGVLSAERRRDTKEKFYKQSKKKKVLQIYTHNFYV